MFCAGQKAKAMYLLWENLSVELPNLRNSSTKKLLNELNGFAEPGRIMAIMGPSGSGKSTLLDSLAGRLSTNLEMSGKILINGKSMSTDCNEISYVTQEDFFLGTLTVRETITYSAHLRLPTKMTKEEIHNIVENTILEMGLHDCADSVIGNWHMRGISTGEKKRLSIGVEILTHPHILFLDEPTTGLDSASAFFVMRAIRNIAYDGKMVICSIHQPSSDVFNLFDDLLLLSSGDTIYFGDAKFALKFFADAGFPCPTRRNPSDHFLRCICVDFDNITEALLRTSKNCGLSESSNYPVGMKTATIRATLIEKYKSSEFATNLQRRIKEITVNGELIIRSNRGSKTGWWKQFCTLTRRSFVNMSRDIGYYWLRTLFYVSISIIIGIIFYKVGTDKGSILVRGKCVCFIYGFMICLSCGGLPFFFEELKVLHRERLGGHYGEAAYVLSNFISSLPFLIVIAISCGTIINYMVKFHPGFSHYAFFCMDLFCCISVIESVIMVVATLVPNVLMGIGIGTSLIVVMMMASEISRPLPDLPKFFWRYPMSYISFATWATQGQFKNDMIGLEFNPLVRGHSKLMKGEILLETLFGIPLSHSKWWDLIALLISLFAHKLIFYLLLKYKLTATSIYHRLHSKSTLIKTFASKVSRGKGAISSSKMHHPSLPLSSQEGLRSPIP